jgi:hypothetical protein
VPSAARVGDPNSGDGSISYFRTTFTKLALKAPHVDKEITNETNNKESEIKYIRDNELVEKEINGRRHSIMSNRKTMVSSV